MSAVAALPFGRPRKRWSVEEYLRLCETGLIGPEDHVELLEGEIVEKMGQNLPHIAGIRALAEALRAVYGPGNDVSQQLPIRTTDSVPEPDVLVLRGSWRDYVARHPEASEVVLVGEVSDASRLLGDRTEKLRIYARAGFGEYWILNLVDRRLEVHRRPQADGTYGEAIHYAEDASLAVAGKEIRVADLLPPKDLPPEA
jgi:Uma2 family endonuclease